MASMQLCELRGGWLYEVRPDVIPQGWMTDEEIGLWAAYYEMKRERERGRS